MPIIRTRIPTADSLNPTTSILQIITTLLTVLLLFCMGMELVLHRKAVICLGGGEGLVVYEGCVIFWESHK
jgi:hypothetical protein